MEDQIRERDGYRKIGKIEQELNQPGAGFCLPKRLHQTPKASHKQGFRVGKIQDAHQNKQEIRGHRRLDARQPHFENRCA